jgi:hypothetical protein
MANNLEREFCSYEQALALEDLGFNEKCLAYFDYYGKIVELCLKDSDWDGCGQDAPLKQHVLRWFREKYDISVYITRNIHFVDDNTKWKPVVSNIYYPQLTFDTYEKAENAAIDKLIELAKQQVIS